MHKVLILTFMFNIPNIFAQSSDQFEMVEVIHHGSIEEIRMDQGFVEGNLKLTTISFDDVSYYYSSVSLNLLNATQLKEALQCSKGNNSNYAVEIVSLHTIEDDHIEPEANSVLSVDCKPAGDLYKGKYQYSQW